MIKIKSFIKANGPNLTGLYLLHASNALLPILIFPRLLYVLGSEIYSEIAVSEAMMFVIQNIILFGFEISGVGLVMNNPQNIRYIFQSRLIITCAILVLSILVASQMGQNVFLLWFLYVLGIVFQNNVYFLATERNDLLAKHVLPSRLIALILIYLWVGEDTSIHEVLLMLGLPVFLSSIGIMFHLRKYRLLHFNINSIEKSLSLIWSNAQIFLSSFSVLLFKDFNLIVVRLLGVSTADISAYSMAEKTVKVLQATIRPVNQLYFKKGVSLLSGYKKPNRRSLIAILRLMRLQLVFLFVAIVSIMCLIIFVKLSLLPESINHDYVLFTLVMLPTLIFGLFNYFTGSLGLNYLGSQTLLLKIFGFNGLISLFVVFLMAYFFGVIGIVLGFLISEVSLSLLVVFNYFTND